MPPKSEQTDVTSQMASMAMSAKDDFLLQGAHPRPGYGSAGQAIKVEANMFQTRLAPEAAGTIHHYDMTIVRVVKTPSDKMPKNLTEKIWAAACRQETNAPDKLAFANSAFDLVKNVYSSHKFTGPIRELVVGLPEEGRELDDRSRFKITLKLANTIDLQSVVDFCQKEKQTTQIANTVLTAIQASNVLFRDDPSKRFHPMGARGKFFGLEKAEPISNGAIVAKGFYQSFRPTSSGMPAVQLNCAFTAMFKSGNLLDLIPQVLGMGGGGGRGGRGGPRGGRGGRGGPPAPAQGHAVAIDQITPYQLKQLNKLFYGAKFTLPHKKTPRTFAIKKFSHQAAADITFTMQGRDGAPSQNITITNYFKQQFNIVIRKPRLPCVVYGKNFMVPVELVQLADFNPVPFAQLSADQAADMIRVAAQRPPDRSAGIKEWRRVLNYENLPKLRSWGLEVNTKMMQVEARVLNPPPVTYKGGKTLRANFGGWNLRGVSFTRPGAVLESWALVSFDNRFGTQDAQHFLGFLINQLKQYGVNVQNTRPPIYEAGRGNHLQGLREGCRMAFQASKKNPQLIICVMGGKETASYQEIKHIAAMKLKEFVPTQCLQAQKLKSDRGLDQYCGNVAMKIQVKLGGVTHEVPMPQIFTKTTMMIGADVTHPPPGGGGLLHPSIAVTVAGNSGDNVKFSVGVRLQEGRTEIIMDLAAMVTEHIKEFESTSGAKPTSIIFFRDGVSEGQYMAVTKLEVAAVHKAAASFGGNYKPKVTFVVCAKRHNMRFFGVNTQDMDKTGNLKPGTVVDQKVTHPFAFDFYLQAHAGLQGTARPTHYIVLVDQNGFTADKMQNFCNQLCYTYARATRAVSIVPVAYYADVIANQCRFMAYVDSEGTETATTISSGSGRRDQTRAYDPHLIAKRLQASAAKRVAWYM